LNVRRLGSAEAAIGVEAIRLLKAPDGYPVPSMDYVSRLLSRPQNVLLVAIENGGADRVYRRLGQLPSSRKRPGKYCGVAKTYDRLGWRLPGESDCVAYDPRREHDGRLCRAAGPECRLVGGGLGCKLSMCRSICVSVYLDQDKLRAISDSPWPEAHAYGRREFALRNSDGHLVIFTEPTNDPLGTVEPD
jgi:hypothetical protein